LIRAGRDQWSRARGLAVLWGWPNFGWNWSSCGDPSRAPRNRPLHLSFRHGI